MEQRITSLLLPAPEAELEVYYFLNKLPFQHLGKKIAPFLKNSLFQLFLTMAHLFVSAFGSLFIFYLILTLILRLVKLFCRNYIIFSRF